MRRAACRMGMFRSRAPVASPSPVSCTLRPLSSGGVEAGEVPRESDESVLAHMAKVRAQNSGSVLPTHVHDVGEFHAKLPNNPAEAGVISEQPDDQRERVVYISQKCNTAMSQGMRKTHTWHISWGPVKIGTNNLMGWTSVSDPLAAMDLEFDSSEAAVTFARKNGWEYEVSAPITTDNDEKMGTNNYSHNFLPKSVENELARNNTRTKYFKHDGANSSHYRRPLNWTGDRPLDQYGPPAPK
eukprot:279026_1